MSDLYNNSPPVQLPWLGKLAKETKTIFEYFVSCYKVGDCQAFWALNGFEEPEDLLLLCWRPSPGGKALRKPCATMDTRQCLSCSVPLNSLAFNHNMLMQILSVVNLLHGVEDRTRPAVLCHFIHFICRPGSTWFWLGVAARCGLLKNGITLDCKELLMFLGKKEGFYLRSFSVLTTKKHAGEPGTEHSSLFYTATPHYLCSIGSPILRRCWFTQGKASPL